MADAGTDVVIVGAGPAGGAAAILLARFGYSCLLIERRARGACKLCGEFLSPESLPILRSLSIDEGIQRASIPEIESVRVLAAEGLSWEGRLPRRGFGITRLSLEEALLRRADSLGVRILFGATARRWARDGAEGWVVDVDNGSGARFQVRARAVVGATGRDGARSTPAAPRGRFIAYQAHFDGPSLQGRVELHTFHGGYAGLIDVDGGLRNLCVMVRPGTDPQRPGTDTPETVSLSNRPDAVIARVAGSSRSFAAWIDRARRTSEWTSASVISWCPETPVLDDGTLTLGDAAGLVPPFVGDGRSIALRSAEIAAPILHEHLSGRISLHRAGATWRRAWRQEFQSRVLAARVLNGILLRPSSLSIFLRVLRAIPPLGGLAITATRGGLRVREGGRG